MVKKVSMGSRAAQPVAQDAEAWINSRILPDPQEDSEKIKPEAAAPEKLKRLTIDLPADLHRALKKIAVDENISMRELILKFVEERCR